MNNNESQNNLPRSVKKDTSKPRFKDNIVKFIMIGGGVLIVALALVVALYFGYGKGKADELAQINKDVVQSADVAPVPSEVPQEDSETPPAAPAKLPDDIDVSVNMTTVLQDLKIKFDEADTGKLISGVAFEAEITDAENNKQKAVDDDMDGVIHFKNLSKTQYTVAFLATPGYALPTSLKATVKDKLDYATVAVSDEIKSERDVNAADEDTTKDDITHESQLKDTVEWVESNSKEVSSAGSYAEIAKANVLNPEKAVKGAFEGPSQMVLGTYQGTDYTLSVSPGYKTLMINETVQLALTLRPDFGSAVYEYTSGAPTVAEVSSTGLVTAKSESGGPIQIEIVAKDSANGNAEIARTTCTIQVNSLSAPAAPNISLSLTSANATLKKGATVSIVPNVGITTPGANIAITYSGNNPAVATVDSNGLIKAIGAGTTQITVTASAILNGLTDTKSATFTITVINDLNLTLEAASATIKVGADPKTFQIKPKVTGNLGNVTYAYASNNTGVAAVNGNGLVTAVATGSAVITITATDTGTNTKLSTNFNVTVSGNFAIALGANATTLKLASDPKTYQLKYSVSGFTSKTAPVPTFVSDKPGVASVSNTGLITAVSNGAAVITATAAETVNGQIKSVTAKFSVTVYDPRFDVTTPLKDISGAPLYVNAGGSYRTAVVADYYTADKFYTKTAPTQTEVYTGWHTINDKVYYYNKNGKRVTGNQIIKGVKYNFGKDGSLVSDNNIWGIDISDDQTDIDFNALKASGMTFVIIRCGYRGSASGVLVEDPNFRQHIAGATAAGLKVGVSFSSQATDVVEAVEEASMALELTREYTLEYPIFINVKASGGRADKLSAADRTAIVDAFCRSVQNSGNTAGVYAAKTWYENSIDASKLSGYKIWVAQHADKLAYTGNYDMWQYTARGTVPGVNGNVALSISKLK